MGLGASLTTFTSGALIQSAQVNTNFNNLNSTNAITASLSGEAETATNVNTAPGMIASGGSLGLSVDGNGIMQVLFAAGLLDWKGNVYQSWSKFGGTGSGTYNHGVPGNTTPNMAKISPISATTQSWSTAQGNATSFTLYPSATWSFNGCAALLQ